MPVTSEATIFAEALRRVSASARAEYLDEACGGDASLRRGVELLLVAHEKAGGVLDDSPVIPDTTSSLPATERIGSTIGPYKLLEQIGGGGMGAVYMAEQLRPVRRKVALKIIKPGMDSRQVVARFEAERQALTMMEHPNIAKVLDAGTTDSGRPYFVMELVKGIPITDYCDEVRLTTRGRLELFIQVCHAVQHAHQKGIIHRDLKPTNVLVTLHDDKPVPKVIDFGIAKAAGQVLTDKTLFTNYAQMLGTPLYMSPEQAQISGLDVDTRSDVYSLGVLLYELLTGTTPFDSRRLREAAYDEMRRIIREEDPPAPSTRLSGLGEKLTAISAHRHTDARHLTQAIHGELDWIVMKALEKDRARRYETANGLARDVERYLVDEPVQACPPSSMYRFRKFARRHKVAFAASLAGVVVVLLGASGLVVSNVLITRQRNLATINERTANEQRQEAQANLKDALAAVDQMLTRVSEERLPYVPQMEGVRRELLQDALRFYEKFLARRSSDLSIRRETALAHARVGSLHFQLGDYEKSESAYRTAFGMLDALEAESPPVDPGMRSEASAFYIGFAMLLRNQAKYEEGEQALRRAVDLATGLQKDFPDVALYRDRLTGANNRLADAIADSQPLEAEAILRRNLVLTEHTEIFRDRAQTYLTLAVSLDKQRHLPEAEEASRQAVALFEKALAKSPSMRSQEVDLGESLRQLSVILNEIDRLQEAEEICRRAIALFDRSAADFPSGPHIRWGQARVRFQHASLLLKLKRSAEAEEAYRHAVELSDSLAKDFPTLPGYRMTAIDRSRVLAEFLRAAGRVDEAKELNSKVARTFENLPEPPNPKDLLVRAHFYGGLGEWDKATADLAKVIELGSNDVLGAWYPLAVLHLRAHRLNEYRSLCETLLARFGQTDDRWVVIVCKLAPGAVADLSTPVRIAQHLADADPKSPECVGVLGDMLYRAGNLQAAAHNLEASIHSGPELVGVQWRKLFLAMTYHRLGRAAEAKGLFGEVTKWMDTNLRGPHLDSRFDWALQLDLELTYREAAELLGMPLR